MKLMKDTLHILTCWNATITQIILKDKDDTDAVCPIDSSPK